MKNLILGYLYSGKFEKNEESFLNIAKDRSIEVTLFDISKEITDEELIELQKCDIIFNDTGEDYSIELIRILEDMGKLVVESSLGNTQENKWNTYQICKKNDIPSPRTILLSSDLNLVKKQLDNFNSWPVILKRVTGTWGEYVERANNLDEAINIINKFWEKGNARLPIIAQEFIDSFSYRVTFIDDEIVQTAIKENNNWKCTGVYARNFKTFDIDDELKDVVKKVMNSFDIKICGIDLLKKDDHWCVIEVNSEPALDFFEDEIPVLQEKIINMIIKMSKKKQSLDDPEIVQAKDQEQRMLEPIISIINKKDVIKEEL